MITFDEQDQSIVISPEIELGTYHIEFELKDNNEE